MAMADRPRDVGATSWLDSATTQVGRPPALAEEGRRLGGVLLRQGRITPQQLAQAIEQQAADEDRGRIGEVLLRLRHITEEDLAQALAAQLDVPYLAALSVEEVAAELVADVPIQFAKQHLVLPLAHRPSPPGSETIGGTGDPAAGVPGLSFVDVACADPLNVFALDELRGVLGAEPLPVVMARTALLELINKVYARHAKGVELAAGGEEGELDEGGAEELVDILDLTDEAPIIRWVNSLLFQAVKERASDIHIEPGEKEVRVRYRIDGVLYESKRANKQFLASVTARIKIMSGLNIAEKRLPQDGRIRRRIAGKDIDMRVATAPVGQSGGERITIRLLDKTSVLLDLADIGLDTDHLVTMEDLIHRPHGILLVTGPTGSGKTTTLYSALSRINAPDLNILTIEDPIEYQLEGISQTQVSPKIDLTFATGLRSFLRHDPDVIMVGEIRDVETAEIAIQASLTGHLVFSTIHTNDAAGGITRLVDMGVEPFLVASSMLGLMAQRLVRKVCPECREPYRPNDTELTSMGVDPARFFAGKADRPVLKGPDRSPPPGLLFRGSATGCPRCLGTGYTGRLGIYEIMLMDDTIRGLAVKNVDATQLKRAATAAGMRTLREDGGRKVLAGVTSIEEVLRVTQEDSVG
jgi:general secretion pathway protein E